jgi:hypothetical protein
MRNDISLPDLSDYPFVEIQMQNNIEDQEITLDDLAAMVNKGFRETHDIITGIRSDLAGFEDKTDSNFGVVGRRFLKIESSLEDLEENMASKDDICRFEKRLDTIEKDIFIDHGRRLRTIERKLQIA